MSTLSPSPMSPLNSATIDTAAISDDVPSSSPFGWRNVVTEEGLRLLIKRAIDVTGALFGLILLSPVLGIVALLIRMDSPGPVLFRQVRRGYRGQPFWVLKFRTMTVDAEDASPTWKAAMNRMAVSSSSSAKTLV